MVDYNDLHPFKVSWSISWPSIAAPRPFATALSSEEGREPPSSIVALGGLLPVVTETEEISRIPFMIDLVDIGPDRIGQRFVLYNPTTGDPLLPESDGSLPVGLNTSSMLSDYLTSASTGGTDTLVPTAGKKLCIHGYFLTMQGGTPTGGSTTTRMDFLTSTLPVFVTARQPAALTVMESVVLQAGTHLLGATNEVLTVTNCTFTGGAHSVRVVVFYQEVD